MSQFIVITEAKPDDRGNLAMAGPLFIEDAEAQTVTPFFDLLPRPEYLGLFLALRAPVFEQGEILVVDDDGREVGGAGRKPSKWGITYNHFNTVEEAIAASRKAVE